MDVVNKILQGDTTLSITIVRAGPDAEKFIVNDEVFKKLTDAQWRKVNYGNEMRKLKEEKFIADNYPGLTTLSDGIRFKVLSNGNGASPADGDILSVKYSGRLINGLSFVSSTDEGKPVIGTKPVIFSHKMGKDGLIKGLGIALQYMKAGETRLLVVPPDMAYGINSGYYGKEISGQKRFVISPGETLILEVTLVKIGH
jgi:FKBP-type peptidyl-prolyl cis-trans isomerase